MNRLLAPPKPQETFELDVFCSPSGDAWRVYVRPSWLPGYLARCFDRHGEAFPVYLDLEDLDYQMNSSGVDYQRSVSAAGGVQLLAKGHAATVLAVWLSQCFASDQRHLGGMSNEVSGMTG